MKAFFLRYGLGSILFLILIFIGLLCIQPTYEAVNNQFDTVKKELISYLEENFGLRVSYSSLSPSILSAFFIKNITIMDSHTALPIAKIDSVYLQYDILLLGAELISGGEIPNAFSKLLIDGMSVTFNEVENSRIREAITSFIEKQPKSDKTDEKKRRYAPFTIVLKNISAHYTDRLQNTFEFMLDTLQFTPDHKKEQFLAELDGRAQAAIFLHATKERDKFGFSFIGNGNVNYDLSAMNATVHFDALEAASYTVSKLSLTASLADSILKAGTVDNGLPFSLSYELDTRTGVMNARMNANSFAPLDLVDTTSENLTFKNIEGSTLSGDYSFFYDPSTGQMRYAAAGSIFVSENLIPQGLRTAFNIDGDARAVSIKSLTFNSPIVDASFSGSYNILEKYPLGEAAINSLILPNGSEFQAEIFLERQNNGFMVFIPQLDFGGQYLTALELRILPRTDSADFSLEVSDYSHSYETDSAGVIGLEGSFLYGTNPFLQSSLSFSNVYLDSLLRVAAFFTTEDAQNNIDSYANMLSPYIISNDIYLSSDFKSLTFNAPAVIIANTKKDREFLILSCTGNESNIAISQLDLLFAGQSLQASLQADIAPDYSNVLFNSAVTFNTVTYNFTGTFFPGAYLGIQGDYGFEVYADFNSPELLTGSVRAAGLPIRVSQFLGALSLGAEFDVPASGDWKLRLNQFELEELSDTIQFKPHISLSGTADKFGLFLDTVIYTDRISVLNGTGSFSWNIDSGIIDTLSANIALLNAQSAEKVTLAATASNPERRALSAVTLLNQLYVSLELDLRNISFARFLPNQTANNTLSASISALGTLNSPFLSARVDNASVSFGGIPVYFDGTVQLNDGQLTLQNSRAEVIYQTFSELEAVVDLKTFTGQASGTFDGRVLQETIHAPFIISLQNNSGSQGIDEDFTASLADAALPEEFAFEMILHNMTGTLAKNTPSGIFSVSRTTGRYDFYAGYDRGFLGSYTDEGELSIVSGGTLPIQFSAEGTLVATHLNVQVNDLFADVSRLQPLLTYPFFHMSTGFLTGSLSFTGLVSDPSFNGKLTVTEGTIGSPQFVGETITIEEAQFIVEDNAILSQNAYAMAKRGKIFFGIETYFDGWRFTQFRLQFKTDTDTRLKAYYNDAPFGKFSGDASCDFILDVYPDLIAIKGGLTLDNTVATLSFQNLDTPPLIENSSDAIVDLELILGKKSQISWNIGGNPILRVLAVPDTALNLKLDTATGDFAFTGIMELRGGDFLYVSRSFYIREGKINFNMNQDNIDPIISFRAETRERDDKNELVRITLTAENQRLSKITPKITSSPPLSEYDLMALLGQVLFTDMRKINNSAIGTLATALDYGAQATLFRKAENQLRNWLNFDIFSLRTAILQNAVLQAYNFAASGKQMTPGNFFDNSTVYIGKYFGNSLYGDALLHLSYNESKINTNLTLGGLVFEPEIGLEMASPFATIRWSLAPEIIESTNNLWVPYMSIQISWKFSL